MQDPYALTEREIEVLQLLAQGYSAKSAGELLYVSPRTVDYHARNAYQKLCVHNRVQAINAARARGYLDSE